MAVPCKLVAVISGRLAIEVYGKLVHRPGPLQGGEEESCDWYNLSWANNMCEKAVRVSIYDDMILKEHIYSYLFVIT